MKKVFIDLGMYDGDSIEDFYNWFKLVDDPEEYDVYGFEPNLFKYFKAEKKFKYRNKIKLSNHAAYIYDGQIKLALSGIGSTLMQGKDNWEGSEKVTVNCFDFSVWLADNFTQEDKVVVKMDIEGAEFPVLRKMLEERTASIPEIMMVEFHPNKVVDYTTDDKLELITKLKNFTNILDWH